MSSNESVKKTLVVALVLCLVCSIVVAGSAVLLKPTQLANRALDRKANILVAAGIETAGQNIDALFENIEVMLVELDAGEYVEEPDPEGYDQLKAARNPALSDALSSNKDVAGINRRERYAPVYLLQEDGKLKTVILPVRGYGLWGTLFGFMALESDANTVVGLTFYEHKETPGLGGEIDNPRWKQQWRGKKIFDAEGELTIGLTKSGVDASDPGAVYKVDALSGATLTSNGVENLIHFWLGENGFGPYLANLRAGEL